MLGAIIGDIAGSRFQFDNHRSKDFVIFDKKSYITDDSLMTLAICHAILECEGDYSSLSERAVIAMRDIGRRYPAEFGSRFHEWLFSENPKPYGSLGNGSAMRVSGIGYIADDLLDTKIYARRVTEVTHNHPEGLEGAEAVAIAIFLARRGKSKEEIRRYIEEHYYPAVFTIEEIRDNYEFDVTCGGSVPVAFEAFYEATSFEDCVRNAISVGGDSDTIGAIAGSLAEAYYGIPSSMREKALSYLNDELMDIVVRFEKRYPGKIIP